MAMIFKNFIPVLRPLLLAAFAGLTLSCMTEKESGKEGRELRIALPDSLRNADSLFIFLTDTLGFRLDTLFNGRPTGDSIFEATAKRYDGGKAKAVFRGFGPGKFRLETFVNLEAGQTRIDVSKLWGSASLELSSPKDSSIDLDTTLDLEWTEIDILGVDETWRVSMGTDSLGVYKSGLKSSRLKLTSLMYGRKYRWRVDRVRGFRVITGPTRSFSTKVEPPRFLEYPKDGLKFRIGAYKLFSPWIYTGGKAYFSSVPALPKGLFLDSLGHINANLSAGIDSITGEPFAVSSPATEYTITAKNISGSCEAKVTISIDSIGGSDRGLVAHWDFEDASGTILSDKSGNGHDGVISNGEWINGVQGKGLWFNGSNSRVAVPFDSSLNLPTYTLAAWIRTVKLKGDQAIIDRVVPSGSIWNYRMLIPGRDVIVNRMAFPKGVVQADVRDTHTSSFEEIVFGKVFVSDGRWHHLVVTNRARLISIYVDGKLDTARIAGPEPETGTTRELLLGDCDYPNVDFKFQGAMDEVRIYDYALDSAEVRASYMSIPHIPAIIEP